LCHPLGSACLAPLRYVGFVRETLRREDDVLERAGHLAVGECTGHGAGELLADLVPVQQEAVDDILVYGGNGEKITMPLPSYGIACTSQMLRMWAWGMTIVLSPAAAGARSREVLQAVRGEGDSALRVRSASDEPESASLSRDGRIRTFATETALREVRRRKSMRLFRPYIVFVRQALDGEYDILELGTYTERTRHRTRELLADLVAVRDEGVDHPRGDVAE